MEPHPTSASIDALVGHAAGRRSATVVVVDVVESVRLIERDEAGTIGRWRALVQAVSERLLPGHGGRLVKSLGDGLMLEFDDIRPAVAVAFALRDECARVNEGVDPALRIRLRVGAHVGEHVVDGLDIYGHDVNLAARLTTLAGPDEIVVSAAVRDRLVDTLDAQVEDLGDCFLKHVSRPVRAYRLGPPGPEPALDALNSRGALRPLVAVIPFTGRAVSAEHEVIGEVIADEVISALSRSNEVDVISRLSTSALRNRAIVPERLAERLGAAFVLSGRSRVSGTRVQVSAELSAARSAGVVWSGSLRATTASLLWGQSALFQELVDAVRGALAAAAVRQASTLPLPSLDTFTLLMAGISLMHRQSPVDYERARRALQLVVDRAPRRAEPRAWLAKWHVLKLMQGWSHDIRDDAQAAIDETQRALDLDPGCSLALAVDGLVQTHFTKRFDVAQQRYETAVDCNPNDSLAWLLKGTLHAFRGEGVDALHDSKRALRLSPLDPIRYFYDSLSATAALAGGEPARAVELAERSLKANRRHTSTLRALAVGRWQTGDVEGARAAVAEMLRHEPELTVSRWKARTPSAAFPISETWAEAFAGAGMPP
ncbi:MAG: adenylate/guanylate cyclase domain-containing protein [Burkholderiales bacterium]